MPITALDPNLIRPGASDGAASSIPDAIDTVIAKVNEVIADGGGGLSQITEDVSDPEFPTVQVDGYMTVTEGAKIDTDNGGRFVVSGVGNQFMIESTNDLQLGFYGAAPVALQTGVAVSAAAIHAALVNLGLIAP